MALNKRKALKELTRELEKNYLLQRACNKLGLTRSTVYRWMQEDEEFAIKLRAAQAIGRRSVNDFVESKLLKNIEEQNQRAIEFWLRSNNEHYASNEKALTRKIESLNQDLHESRAALATVGDESIFKRFIDWKQLNKYVHSPEWQEGMARLDAVRQGTKNTHNPHEIEVIEQARKIIVQLKLAQFVANARELPEEHMDPVD